MYKRQELKKVDAKVYATYYTTRKDNVWAKANPDEIQQMYIMTSFHTATKGELSIHLMDHLYPDMLKVNSHDDIQRWWEVIDRTTGKVVPDVYKRQRMWWRLFFPIRESARWPMKVLAIRTTIC